MNALWITHMSAYKYSPLCLEAAKSLVAIKVGRQSVLLKKYHRASVAVDFSNARAVADISLEEARAAKRYWSEFKLLLPQYARFNRQARATDTVNRLLDIGYHHTTNIVRKILESHDISPALGIMHVARKSDSAPLAYDLVELFRADIVDTEVLRFLRLKKKLIISIDQREIGHFLHEINERIEHLHYLRDFRQCHTYRYYMELQILKFISAVNHASAFEPLHLPSRHDGRCGYLTPSAPVVSSMQEVL
jgi:CRISPR-associated endonuclease Cas1